MDSRHRDADDAAGDEGGGFGDDGGEGDVIGVRAAAEILAAEYVVVVEHVLVRTDGDEAVVGVVVVNAAVPSAGVAILATPKNFRPIPRWHVRTYGLFTANPFGESDFPKHDAAKQGPVTIKNGDSLSLRYRILLHAGGTDKADLDAAVAEFANDTSSPFGREQR